MVKYQNLLIIERRTEMLKRVKKKEEDYRESLERIFREVDSWPKWKKLSGHYNNCSELQPCVGESQEEYAKRMKVVVENDLWVNPKKKGESQKEYSKRLKVIAKKEYDEMMNEVVKSDFWMKLRKTKNEGDRKNE